MYTAYVQCTMYTVQCKLYNVQYIVHCILYMSTVIVELLNVKKRNLNIRWSIGRNLIIRTYAVREKFIITIYGHRVLTNWSAERAE